MPSSVETIKVFIRFKGNEVLNQQDQEIWRFEGPGAVTVPNLALGLENTEATNGGTLTFDKILLDTTQEDMYAHVAQGTVKQFTKGYNGTIFAYGQSGSGKTYSMLGPEEVVEVIKSGEKISEEVQKLYGIIPRAIRDFFQYMNSEIEQ
jgi:hypothetical protein